MPTEVPLEERRLKAEADKATREADRRRRRVEAANIPLRYHQYRVSDMSADVRRWTVLPNNDAEDGAFFDWRKDGLYLYGEFGTGKTAQACAALRYWAAELDYESRFLTTTELLDRIKRVFDTHEHDDVLEDAKTVEVLLLDDIGAEKVTDWVRDRLFAVINERYNERRVTLFTSNLAPDKLAEHVGERIAWRILEMCRVVKLVGENKRQSSTTKKLSG